MPKTPRIKAKDFFKYLNKYDCTEISINGSHHKIRNNRNNKISIVAIHSNEDIYPGMLLGILKQLGINANDFIKFIENKGKN